MLKMRRSVKRSRGTVRLVDHHERQVQELRDDPVLLRGLLDDALRELIYGDEQAALILLRDIIAAAGGFPQLAHDIDVHPKALHRMFSDRGNPTTTNLAAILRALTKRLDLKPAERLLTEA
jgi:DNA-binding phage protein